MNGEVIDEIIDNVDDNSIEQLKKAMIIIFVNSLKQYTNCATRNELFELRRNNYELYKKSFKNVMSMMPPIIFDIVIDFIDEYKIKKENQVYYEQLFCNENINVKSKGVKKRE